MKNIFVIITIAIAVMLCSCYADKGNYDYREINEVAIVGMPDTLVTKFKNADTLKVTPLLEDSFAENGDYEYTWLAVLKNDKVNGQFEFEIGKEKDLNYFIDLPLGMYAVYLNVLDKNTGVTWRNHFDLNVITATTTGWLVLCDEQGEARLDMISKAGKEEFMVWDLLGDYDIPNKLGPKKILCNVNNPYGTTTGEKIVLITETGACYLDPEYLTWEEAFDLKYEMGKVPEPFLPTAVVPVSYNWETQIVLLTTTEVYCKNVSSGYVFELPRNNIQGEDKTFKVAPFVITSGEDVLYQADPPVLLYDIDNNRFVQLSLDFTATSCRVPVVGNEVWSMDTGKDFVFAANGRQNSSSSFVLLRDENDKIWLYGIGSLTYNSFVQLPNYYYPIDAPNIERAKLFAVHPYYYFLFYVVDDIIYQFDMVSKETRKLEPVDENGNLVSFAGEEITFLKFNPLQYGYYGSYTQEEGWQNMEYRLIVGSDKGGENGGVVRFFNIGERIGDAVSLYKTYTGFAKPVDIVYRERML